jgi:hypothetical protein
VVVVCLAGVDGPADLRLDLFRRPAQDEFIVGSLGQAGDFRKGAICGRAAGPEHLA